jgi:hypothetical protein
VPLGALRGVGRLAALAPDGQSVAFAYGHACWFPTTLRFRKLMFSNCARVE